MFAKKIWKDRQSEFPNRRDLVKADGTAETVEVRRNEGEVLEPGTLIGGGESQ